MQVIDLSYDLSYTLILLVLVGMAKHAQITRNSKLAKYMQYSKILHFGLKFSQN